MSEAQIEDFVKREGAHCQGHCRYNPPDGGWRAILVACNAFLCTGIVVGITVSYGVIHPALQEKLQAEGVADASSKSALVGSLTLGSLMLLSPVAGILADFIGIRLSVIIGSITCTLSMLLSSYCTNNITALYFTFGIMFGFGASIVYTPSLTIVGHYFKRHLGIVLGLVECGTTTFAVLLSWLLPYVIQIYSLEIALRVLAFLVATVFISAFAYKPIPNSFDNSKTFVINNDIWKNKKYIIWTICNAFMQFGYYAPMVHIVKFSQATFPQEDSTVAVICIAVSSGVGRFLCGFVGDCTRIRRVTLQQISYITVGLAVFALALNTASFHVFIALSVVIGFCDGFIIALNGAIAIEICGPRDAAQAIGFFFGATAIPLIIGPAISGKIYDTTGSYTTAFILASVFIIIGGGMLSLIKCVRQQRMKEEPLIIANGHTSNYSSCLN